MFLVDDHQLFRSGLRAELGDEFEIVGEAEDADTAITEIARSQPAVVVLDVHLPGGGGRAVLEACLRRYPEIRFLALSVSDAPADVIQVIRAGARGYVTKSVDPVGAGRGDPCRAWRRRGLLAAPGGFRARRLPRRAAGVSDPELDQLTVREREVLRHIARGFTYKEVAVRLHLSVKTVETHVSSVLRKLQLSNRHELTRWAVDRRMV